MAKIPTVDAIEPPRISGDRPAATIDSDVLRARTGGATALMKVAEVGSKAAEEMRKQQEQDDDLDADLRVIEYVRGQSQALDKARRDMQPGGDGFSDRFRQEYDTGARAIAQRAAQEGLSLRARRQLNRRLVEGAWSLGNQASRYEEDEHDRFSRAAVEGELMEYSTRVRADPSQRDEQLARGGLHIRRSSLNAAHRYAVEQAFRRKLMDDWHAGLGLLAQQGPEGARRARELLLRGSALPEGATDARPRVRNRASEGVVPPGTEPGPVPGEIAPVRRPGGPAASVPALGGEPPASEDDFTRWVAGQESFRERPYSDFRQTSVGYGTRARPGETSITREEADRRLRDEIGRARTQVRQFASGLTPGQENALTDLTFNTGGAWMQSGLGRAVKAGDWTEAQRLFVQYVNAGEGENRQRLQGLVDRRNAAVSWLAPAGAAPQSAPAGGQGQLAPSPAGPEAEADFSPNSAPPMRLGGDRWADFVVQRATQEAERGGDAAALDRLSRARTTLNSINAVDQQRVTALNTEILSWERAALEGKLPPREKIAQTRADTEEIGNDGLTANFNYMLALAQRVEEIRRMPLPAMRLAIDEEEARQRERGANDFDIRRLARLRTLYETAEREVGKNANAWAREIGLPGAREGFSGGVRFDDPAGMRRRLDLARRVSEYYGAPIRYLIPEEEEQARNMLRQGGPGMTRMLSAMTRHWGPDAVYQLLQRTPDGKFQDPELATVGGMVVNAENNGGVGRQLADDLAAEVHLRRTDPAYETTAARFRPTPQDSRAAREFIGRTFEANPAVGSAIEEAANLLYLRWARTNAVTAFDDRRYREIFMQVLGQSNGQPGTSNAQNTYGGIHYQSGRSGNPIPVPSNIRNDSGLAGIPTIMGVLQIEDLRAAPREDRSADAGYAPDPAAQGARLGPVGEKGRELPIRDIREGRLVSIGGGRYLVDTKNDPNNPGWAQAPPGVPAARDFGGKPDDNRYVLDLGALEPVIRERVPEVYRDYQFGETGRWRPRGMSVGPGAINPRTNERMTVPQFGPGATIGPDHPDYPKGQFAPVVNPGRAITQPEWIEFHRQFRERHPTQRERDAITSSQSRYWKELQQFIDKLPPQAGGAAPAGGDAARASLAAVSRELSLNTQERTFYQHHLNNLHGAGGIDQPGGARSTVIGTRMEIDGRTYILPTVFNGKQLEPGTPEFRAAIKAAGGLDAFPSYATDAEAEEREKAMHDFMERDTQAYQRSRRGTGGPGVVDRVRGAVGTVYERVFGRPEPAPPSSVQPGRPASKAEPSGVAAVSVVPPDRIWASDGDTTGNEAAIRKAATAVAKAPSLEDARRTLSGMVQRQSEADDPEEADALARENRSEFFNMYSWRGRVILRAVLPEYVDRQGRFRRGLSDKQRREGEIIVALYNELTQRENADTRIFNAYRTEGTPQSNYYTSDPTTPSTTIRGTVPGSRRSASVVTGPMDDAAFARFPFKED